jgi:hypothetical protein
MENPAAVALNDLLITKNFEPEAKDARGLDVEDPADAKMFSFDWTTENKNYGTVVVLLSEDGSLTMYFGDNLGRTMESDDKKEWYAFLEQMKTFAVRNKFKNFSLDNISRLKYTMQGMAAIKEGLFEGYYGKKNISYSDQPKQVRLMIKHSRDIKEGEARYRAIESLFVETADGERFRVPSRSLMHGRMLARHCAEGGTPHDTFGNYINEMVSEMATLARFVRAAKHKPFAGEAAELVEAAVRHYSDLKAKAKHMISQRGYHEARETFDPAVINNSSEVAESIRNMFIEQTLDSRIEEALPILAKLKEPAMREADEFESWANKVMEGTWALADTPETQRQLQDLMSKPLIVGADATNATEQLYDLVGDDILFDRLGDLADRDPNANCWEDPGVINRLGELGIDINPTTGPQDMTEGHEDSSVASALTRRIMTQRLDLLKKYGPVKVMSAIDSAAEFFGDVEEIGSSDMHAYMQYVEKALDGMNEQGLAEGVADMHSDELLNTVRDAIRKAIKETGDQSLSKIFVCLRSAIPASEALKNITSPISLEAVDNALQEVGIDFDDLLNFINKQAEKYGKQGVAEGLNEDLQADDGEYYENADDFFGQFEAESFDNEEQSEDGMEIRGYIDGVNVMVWRYEDESMTGGYGYYDDSALNQDLAEGTSRGIMLNGKEVDMRSLEIENVDSRDYPDFSDAYIGRASFTDGTDLSDQEMVIKPSMATLYMSWPTTVCMNQILAKISTPTES